MSENYKKIMFYITLFLFILLIGFQTNSADYDLFARLLQGKAFWQLGNILQHDIFSYTPTHIWYDHEWGSSVVFYAVFAKFGALGLLLLKSLMIFGIFFFIIEALKVRGLKYSTPYNFLFYFLAYHAAAHAGFSNTIRCQLFTYLFFAIWVYLLERVRQKGENYWLVSFVPMMLFWSNIHGGCAAGFGLLVLYALGEALNHKAFKYYIYTFIACSLIVFVNPWGIGYVEFLIKATTMPRIMIEEWQPTFGEYNANNLLIFKVFFGVMLLVVLLRFLMKLKTIKNIDYTKAIVLATMTYLCVRYTRHQPFFVLSSIVFLYDDFYCIWNKAVQAIIKSKDLLIKLDNIKLVTVCFFVAFATTGYLALNKPEMTITNQKYPIKAIEFIKQNGLNGRLLVNFHHGSYAAYKLFPNNLIAMDGRYEEVYEDYMLPMFNNFFMQVGENPNMFLEVFPPELIVMENQFPAKALLDAHNKYKKVYEDDLYSLFIDKRLEKKVYKQPTDDKEYYNNTLFDSKLKFIKPKK